MKTFADLQARFNEEASKLYVEMCAAAGTTAEEIEAADYPIAEPQYWESFLATRLALITLWSSQGQTWREIAETLSLTEHQAQRIWANQSDRAKDAGG